MSSWVSIVVTVVDHKLLRLVIMVLSSATKPARNWIISHDLPPLLLCRRCLCRVLVCCVSQSCSLPASGCWTLPRARSATSTQPTHTHPGKQSYLNALIKPEDLQDDNNYVQDRHTSVCWCTKCIFMTQPHLSGVEVTFLFWWIIVFLLCVCRWLAPLLLLLDLWEKTVMLVRWQKPPPSEVRKVNVLCKS